jgi:plasmanylethanolamine desaturase
VHSIAPNPQRRLRRVLGHYDYPTKFRIFEVGSLVLFSAAAIVFVRRLANEFSDRFSIEVAGLLFGASIAAFFIADFLSGFVHFLCDNLGTPDTPIVGQKFIKSFRDHHDTPMDMTKGDFISVNADNFSVCLPALIPCAIWLDVEKHLFAGTFLAALIAFVTITNEAHKWAHVENPPNWIRRVQSTRLILTPQNHAVHHTAPFDSNYCITSGALNPLLARLRFWDRLLRVCRR